MMLEQSDELLTDLAPNLHVALQQQVRHAAKQLARATCEPFMDAGVWEAVEPSLDNAELDFQKMLRIAQALRQPAFWEARGWRAAGWIIAPTLLLILPCEFARVGPSRCWSAGN